MLGHRLNQLHTLFAENAITKSLSYGEAVKVYTATPKCRKKYLKSIQVN